MKPRTDSLRKERVPQAPFWPSITGNPKGVAVGSGDHQGWWKCRLCRSNGLCFGDFHAEKPLPRRRPSRHSKHSDEAADRAVGDPPTRSAIVPCEKSLWEDAFMPLGARNDGCAAEGRCQQQPPRRSRTSIACRAGSYRAHRQCRPEDRYSHPC